MASEQIAADSNPWCPASWMLLSLEKGDKMGKKKIGFWELVLMNVSAL